MFCIGLNGAEATSQTIKRQSECYISHVIDYIKVLQCAGKNVINKISEQIKAKIFDSPIALHSKFLLQLGWAQSRLCSQKSTGCPLIAGHGIGKSNVVSDVYSNNYY